MSAPDSRTLRAVRLTALLLLMTVPLGCRKAPEQAAEESHPAPVHVAGAETVKLAGWTELPGTTQPLPGRVARVSAPVEGRVLSLLVGEGRRRVAEGDVVKEGQVLVRLDDRVVRANRDKLAATLAELEEQKNQARYAVELADIEVKRLEGLGRNQPGGSSLPLVSRVELEKARVSRKDALSKQKGADAKLATTRAELKAAETQLDFYTLRAPISGRLGLVNAMTGQTLPAGTAVAEVVDLDEIDVLCYAPPRLIARLEDGQPARLGGSNGPQGKVVYVAVQAQADTGNFAVKVRFPNPKAALKTNGVVRVLVQTEAPKQRTVIPESALMEDQDPPAVVVAVDVKSHKNEEGKEEKLATARKLRAVVGVRDREHQRVEVRDLYREDPETKKRERVKAKGALFVVEGAHGVQDGDPLKLEEEKEEEKKDQH
jgi:RND family efflux transporter MFP subunit